MKLAIHTDGFEGFRNRSLERARMMDRGERVPPSFSLTFESPGQMFEALTEQRLLILEALRTKSYSMTALANRLKRDPKSVRRDVAKLEQFGLIRTRPEVNPGHGRVKIVEPVAKRFELRVSF